MRSLHSARCEAEAVASFKQRSKNALVDGPRFVGKNRIASIFRLHERRKDAGASGGSWEVDVLARSPQRRLGSRGNLHVPNWQDTICDREVEEQRRKCKGNSILCITNKARLEVVETGAFCAV